MSKDTVLKYSTMRQKVKERIDKIVNALKNMEEVKRVILFGSLVKSNKDKGFDIDLYLEENKPISKRDKRKIKELIDDIAGIYTVDLIFDSEISEDFRKTIKREGMVLYEKG